MLEETELKAGKFGVIRSLLRALDGGAAAKAALDAVVDACSGMQVGAVGGLRLAGAAHVAGGVEAPVESGGEGDARRLGLGGAGPGALDAPRPPPRPLSSAPASHAALLLQRRLPPPAPQNLREAIASYRGRIFYEANDARRQSLLQARRGRGGVRVCGWGACQPSTSLLCCCAPAGLPAL